MKLSERINMIVEYSGMSIPKYAQSIGVQTPQAIRDLINGKTKSLSADMQSKILSYSPEINPLWLFTGEGEMINESVAENQLPTGTYREDEIPERYMTYLVPMAAMGGSLNGYDGVGVRREDCEKVISPVADADWVIPVCGDSMEPEYPNGSRVYVKQINPGDFIAWGNVFVLDTTNGVVIKVVTQSDRKDCIRCVSLNPSGRYLPFDVPKRAIRAMYRVLLCASVK